MMKKGIAVFALVVITISAIALTGIDASIFDFLTKPPIAIVRSNSMAPSLEFGDIAIVRYAAPESIKEGDIICFSVGAAEQHAFNYPSVVIHRVKSIESREGMILFRTAGDRTGDDPFLVDAYNIRGVYIDTKIPKLGLGILFLQTLEARMYLLFATIFLLSLKFLPDLWDSWKRREERMNFIYEGIRSMRSRGYTRGIILRRDGTGRIKEIRVGSDENITLRR